MAEVDRHAAILAALREAGRPHARILLWTTDPALADLARKGADSDLVHLALPDGWSGWVMVREPT